MLGLDCLQQLKRIFRHTVFLRRKNHLQQKTQSQDAFCLPAEPGRKDGASLSKRRKRWRVGGIGGAQPARQGDSTAGRDEVGLWGAAGVARQDRCQSRSP